MGTYLTGTGTLGWAVWYGARIPSLPRYRSQFLSITHGCGTTHSASASLHLSTRLPIFPTPTHLDECDLFNSLVVRFSYRSIFWWFRVIIFFCSLVVIFAVVVQGGKMCLPTPPSWPEVSRGMFLKLLFLKWVPTQVGSVPGQSEIDFRVNPVFTITLFYLDNPGICISPIICIIPHLLLHANNCIEPGTKILK